ncbi:MAG: aspartate--ammonia ligase [Clostridia bacterium]|nr:aspartate--ammonia ligase [Clostridia bacterium]
MFKIQLKDGYKSALSPRETSTAISFIKASFQKNFSKNLNLERITAPLFVTKKSGLNDDLSGVERKVEITFKEMNEPSEVVQSLAKWKRVALSRYGFNLHEGLYTDMNAIRRDDSVDNIHSVFVDQWDWEMVISKEDRNIEFLKDVVRKIVISISETQEEVNSAFPKIQGKIEKNVHFITTQELLDLYPELSSKDRENEIVKKYKTVFLMKIGDDLSNGEPHDGRAPDYDDWALNGDLLVWNDVLDIAFELSSMGIRVDKQSLIYQIEKANATERLKLDYHQAVVNEKLPLTIGGGIGQSRLCMYLLQKLHIGEVQVSVWPEEMLEICAKNNIEIL